MATETITAARVLPPTRRRRATTAVLGAGTVVSLAAAFGPVWVVRGGLLVAIAAAVVTTVLAWQEVKADRRDHAATMLAAGKAHGEILRIERSHNASVLQVVTERSVAALAEITRQQTVIGQLRGELTSLKGDRAALTAQISRRETLIFELREAVRAREADLDAARAETAAARDAAEAAKAAALAGAEADDEAEVHAMPRRVLVDGEDQPRRASEPDPRTDVKTVVDLGPNGLDRGLERKPEWHEPVLPNYEEDRRPA